MNAPPPYVIRKLRKKQRRLVRRLILVLVTIVLLSLWLWPRVFPNSRTISSPLPFFGGSGNDEQTDEGSYEKIAPDFSVLTPDGKSLEDIEGWTFTPPGDDGTKFFAYLDSVGSVGLQVSQQELPPSFTTDASNQLEALATSFYANRELEASDGTTIYIGTSESGPQSLITTKAGLLILIKSSSMMSNEQWIAYIDSLR